LNDNTQKSSRTYDFHKEAKSASRYTFSVVNPQSGQNTLSLSGAVQKPVIFELPTNPFNFSKTYLNFSYTLPTQKDPADAGNFLAWIYRDVIGMIDSMRLRTSQNVELMNISDFRMYTKLLKKDILFEDFKTVDECEFLVPNRGKTGRGESKYYAAAADFKSQDEPEYCYSTLAAIANNASDKITVRFPLGKLIGTIFELDKTLYFPESIFLHVVFGPVGRAGWRGTAPDAPATGAGDLLITPVAVTNFTDIHLMLAVERNESVIRSLHDQVNGPGLNVLIPTIRCDPNTVSGSNQTVTIRLSAADGQKLRRIWHTCAKQADLAGAGTQYNISNGTYTVATDTWSTPNVNSYYVMVDNDRVSGEMDILCHLAQDWLVNREHLKNSVIQNAAMYKREWHHQEDFSGIREDPYDEKDGVPKANLTGGLNLLDKERKITFVFRMTGADDRNHYTFSECERNLFISQKNIGLDVETLPPTPIVI